MFKDTLLNQTLTIDQVIGIVTDDCRDSIDKLTNQLVVLNSILESDVGEVIDPTISLANAVGTLITSDGTIVPIQYADGVLTIGETAVVGSTGEVLTNVITLGSGSEISVDDICRQMATRYSENDLILRAAELVVNGTYSPESYAAVCSNVAGSLEGESALLYEAILSNLSQSNPYALLSIYKDIMLSGANASVSEDGQSIEFAPNDYHVYSIVGTTFGEVLTSATVILGLIITYSFPVVGAIVSTLGLVASHVITAVKDATSNEASVEYSAPNRFFAQPLFQVTFNSLSDYYISDETLGEAGLVDAVNNGQLIAINTGVATIFIWRNPLGLYKAEGFLNVQHNAPLATPEGEYLSVTKQDQNGLYCEVRYMNSDTGNFSAEDYERACVNNFSNFSESEQFTDAQILQYVIYSLINFHSVILQGRSTVSQAVTWSTPRFTGPTNNSLAQFMSNLNNLYLVGTTWADIVNTIIPAVQSSVETATNTNIAFSSLMSVLNYSSVWDSGAYNRKFPVVKEVSKSDSFFITPPSYTTSALFISALLGAGIAIAATSAYLLTKGRIRRSTLRVQLNKYNKLERAQLAYAANPTTANYNDYYVARRQYNRVASVFGGTTLNGVVGVTSAPVQANNVNSLQLLNFDRKNSENINVIYEKITGNPLN